MPRPFIDGGYYTRTRENRPLIGPLEVEGSFVIGALSGFGLMASMGAGQLLAAHVTGDGLPDYARWFVPSRYADPEYMALVQSMEATGQL
jgi:glycine/D-amino acid oxidase-like deaminating enzyme